MYTRWVRACDSDVVSRNTSDCKTANYLQEKSTSESDLSRHQERWRTVLLTGLSWLKFTAAVFELRDLCENKIFSTRVPVLPTGSSLGSARALEKRDPYQQDWRAGGSLAYAVCLGNSSSLAATLSFSVFVPRSQQFTELCLLSFLPPVIFASEIRTICVTPILT